MEHAVISPWEMLSKADIVVKSVICIIVLLSLWSWYTMFKLWLGARIVRQQALQEIGQFKSVWQSPQDLNQADGLTDIHFRELLSTAMKRRAQETLDGFKAGLPALATVSSLAPFIGLFGTVWGIMNSFIGIAASKDTSLAVVAPGIAEALIVTALGLAAAIPASFAYNRFAATFASLNKLLSRAIDDRVDQLTLRSLSKAGG
ncbi:MAG: MotA/TolQ/ExbB proton channel family protein [Proteobacteria bacterium]|nr:MotA/TolQ/ExbB proton channel family protein [Pseudomonadota bacterium]